MHSESLKIDTSTLNGSKGLILAEFLRGRREANPKDTFALEEVKKEGVAVLSLVDDSFEAEAVCNPKAQTESHVLAYVENGRLKLVDVPYHFSIGKRVKTETHKVVRRGSMSYQEKKELVVQEIGTTKSKKILKNQRTKHIDEQKIASMQDIQDQIDKRADGLRQETETRKQTEADQKIEVLREMLPEFDARAAHPEGIYSENAIVSAEILQKMDTAVFLNKLKTERVAKATAQIVEKTGADLTKLDSNSLRLWSYLDAMLTVYPIRKIYKSAAELAKEKGLLPAAVEDIYAKFYQQGTNDEQKDVWVKTQKSSLKFAAFITVLYLLLNKLKFRLDVLYAPLGIAEAE